MKRRVSSAKFAAFLFAILALLWTGLFTAAASTTLAFAAQTQQPAQTPSADQVPVTDGQSGPCSIEFNVTSTDGKPVFSARIDVHIEYGFGGFHKLDMGVYTNAQGKARFTGIPAKVKRPPIEFHASKEDLVGIATMDPVAECQTKHDIILDKAKPPATDDKAK